MDFEKILSTFPENMRELPALRGLIVLIQTLMEQLQSIQEQLQSTQEQLARAQAKIKLLEDELARLRKTPKRPKFRSNGMEPRNRSKGNKGNPSNIPPSVNSSLIQKKVFDIKIAAKNVPEGSRFKGYQDFTIQEIDLVAKQITYKLEVWQAPDGTVVRAHLPEDVNGQHFGPILKAFATNLYAHGVTQPALYEFLTGLGFEISAGKTNDILLDEAEQYATVSEEILTAGLEEAPFIRADDTGAKHQHKPGYCTHIGGEFFAYYKTTFSKARENFLKILLQGKECYQINEAMIWHLFQSGVEDDILNLLEEHKGKTYRSAKGLSRLLNKLGVGGKKVRKQCNEAGLVGFIAGSILRTGQVFLSDRAGQFALFKHAACWVHMERPLRKIICSSEQVEKELSEVREAIWATYRALKQVSLEQEEKERVYELYNRLIAMKTISPEINSVIANFVAYREELLMALEHPGLPLHNNDSERDIRAVAKRRNISGSTKSDRGLKFRDGLQSLKQTCFRLNYSFWDYLQLWFRGDPPNLADMVRNRYRTTHT